MKIVAFGTSLTERGRWPADIETSLRARGRDVRVVKLARSGATTRWAVEQIPVLIRERPDLMLVEFYANDASLKKMVSIEESAANLDRILKSVRQAQPRTAFVLMTMNPFLGLKGAVRPFLGGYIDAHNRIGRAYGARFIDFSPLWRQLGADGLNRAIPDGSHPDPVIASRLMVGPLTSLLM